MRVSVYSMIVGMFMLFIVSSASAGPLFQYIGNGASIQGFQFSCPMKDFLISADNLNQDNSSFYFPTAQGSDVPAVEPNMVLAGMWVLQSKDIASLGEAGRPFEDLLIPLFAGSLLIGLSGLIRMRVRKQPLTYHEKTPEKVKVKVSYEKTLWAESHGLM